MVEVPRHTHHFFGKCILFWQIFLTTFSALLRQIFLELLILFLENISFVTFLKQIFVKSGTCNRILEYTAYTALKVRARSKFQAKIDGIH